ncbi:hypothetical protein JTB14_010273 [Gonioctena quinquepunctata]|nr:hypothetical protein JTB14_010273 [Gonioctena quinquepunctata]
MVETARLLDGPKAPNWREGKHKGLVGVAVKENDGVLVEVNCETDFVARNGEFQKIVAEAADTCLNFVKKHQRSQDRITKICLDAEQLKNLKAEDGKSLADKLAMAIGTLGENATLKRAMPENWKWHSTHSICSSFWG